MRIAAITDKHVKSHFVPIVIETPEGFLNISIFSWSSLISVHCLTFYTLKPGKELTIRLTE